MGYIAVRPSRCTLRGRSRPYNESKFGKRKYNRGRVVDGHWVFGRIERGSGECFLVEVEKQDAATLLPLISQHVRPRSTVLSDEWSSYNQLTATTGNIHLTVNHLLHFVDPTTGAYTQSVEGIWSCCKRMMREEKVMHCTSGPHMLGNKGKQGCS